MATANTSRRARFTAMDEGGPDDWAIISSSNRHFAEALPERVLRHLRLLGDDHGGFAVDRLTHCLQTATRVYRANKDDELILCALIHDIGDSLAPYNHADIAAALLKPFVSAERHWLVEHHTIFQGYHYFHHFGFDRNYRDEFRGEAAFDETAEFCDDFDQAAFDPKYDTLPLEHFEPLVTQLLATPLHPQYGFREPVA